MKELNQYSKRGGNFLAAYWRSNKLSLRNCYNNYSFEKGRAEAECRKRMIEEEGYGFKILSYNTFGFTCGWQRGADLRIETPQNSYIIKDCIAPF